MNTPHLIEIALLMLAAFLIWCVIGFFLRKMISGESATSEPQSTASTTNQTKTASAAAPAPAKNEKEAQPAKPAEAKVTATPEAEQKPAEKPKTAAKTTKKPASKASGTADKPKTTAKPKTATKAKPAVKKPAAKKPAPKKADTADAGKPATLSAPREGQQDDLKNIKGVGPKIEGILNGMGIYHFDQIAGWGPKEVEWVDKELSFKGRIDREEWISQAKKLAK